MEYTEKLAIANAYIGNLTDGFEWDDLGDINSLHDCDTQEDIFTACDERLLDSGFSLGTDDTLLDKPIVENIDDILMSDEEEDDDDLFVPDID